MKAAAQQASGGALPGGFRAWLEKPGPRPFFRLQNFEEKVAANTLQAMQRRRAQADVVIEELQQQRTIAAGALAHGRMPDSALRELANRRAELLQGHPALQSLAAHPESGLHRLNGLLVPLQARPFAFEGDKPQSEQLRGFVARAVCPLWWRRQLRRAAVLLRETEANQKAEVSAIRRQPYITHDTAHRHQMRARDAAAMMGQTQLENEDGQCMSLADLAAASVSSPAIRRGELMTRISGCEKWAAAVGLRGVFLTLTAPSRFHRVHRTGKPNDKHDGSTPRDAQDWLCSAWARARAKLQRKGLALFGFRVAEPHHDGCPHWHALLWAAPGQLWRAVKVIKRAWLKLEGTEPGARAHRCKAVLMRPGGASGYIAKYVAKNIDDAGAVGAQGHTDDDYSDAVPEAAQKDAFGGTAQRVQAWASAWGIRQFQAIGQPPVTVWRELRRVKEKDGATARMGRALEACNRTDSGRADWAGYVLAQGGMNTGRNYLLRLHTISRLKVGRYETEERPCPVGVRDSTGPGDVQISERRQWKPRGTWTAADKVRGIWAPNGAAWTRVNNCTQRRGAGLIHAAGPDPEAATLNPGGGSTLEGKHSPWIKPHQSNPQSEKRQRLQAICRHMQSKPRGPSSPLT